MDVPLLHSTMDSGHRQPGDAVHMSQEVRRTRPSTRGRQARRQGKVFVQRDQGFDLRVQIVCALDGPPLGLELLEMDAP